MQSFMWMVGDTCDGQIARLAVDVYVLQLVDQRDAERKRVESHAADAG